MAAESRIARLGAHIHSHQALPTAAAPSEQAQQRTGAAAPARCAAGADDTQSYVLRHWDQVVPYVGHESALIWPIFRGVDAGGDGGWANNVMNGMTGWTIHRVQGRRDGDYHAHPEAEQLYYFLTPAKMLIDGATISVVAVDLLHVPPRVKHHLLNAHSEDWVEHLLVTAPVSAAMLGELDAAPEAFREQLVRNYRDASPTVVAHPGTRNGGSHNEHGHHCAIEWELAIVGAAVLSCAYSCREPRRRQGCAGWRASGFRAGGQVGPVPRARGPPRHGAGADPTGGAWRRGRAGGGGARPRPDQPTTHHAAGADGGEAAAAAAAPGLGEHPGEPGPRADLLRHRGGGAGEGGRRSGGGAARRLGVRPEGARGAAGQRLRRLAGVPDAQRAGHPRLIAR